jgi:hypothetical protein
MMHNSIRHRLVVPVFIFSLLSVIAFVYARSTGITGRTMLSSTPGCTCHSAEPWSNVSVLINGPDTMETNATATFEVTISGGPLAAAGTNIAADMGELNILNSALQKTSSELTHTSPLAPSGGKVTFTFQYTAPGSSGQATIAASGNSVNLNGANTGDNWNFADNKIVQIVLPSALPSEDDLLPARITLRQNYPNPFNPTTTIVYSLEHSAFVSLDVYDMAGKQVAQLVSRDEPAGDHRITFDAASLTSGVYVYRLSADNQQLVKQMLLLK